MKKFYERYWDGTPAELADFKYKWPVLSPFIPKHTCRILDYGCGKGKILSEIRSMNPHASLYGADISAIARKAAKISVPNSTIVAIDSNQSTHLPSHSFDFMLSLDVIEHIYDTEKVFIEFNRLLKKGGILLLSTPYNGLIKNIIISIIGFDIVFDPISPHIRFYTKKSLERLLQKYGFSIVKFGYYGRLPFVWRGMFAIAKKN